jgi:hypothetical protein
MELEVGGIRPVAHRDLRLVKREFRLVFPEEARGLLNNKLHGNLTDAVGLRIAEYLEAMQNGTWNPHGNSRSTGKPAPLTILNGVGTTDGHWRLEAVILSGQPQPFIVENFEVVLPKCPQCPHCQSSKL